MLSLTWDELLEFQHLFQFACSQQKKKKKKCGVVVSGMHELMPPFFPLIAIHIFVHSKPLPSISTLISPFLVFIHESNVHYYICGVGEKVSINRWYLAPVLGERWAALPIANLYVFVKEKKIKGLEAALLLSIFFFFENPAKLYLYKLNFWEYTRINWWRRIS